MMTQQKMLSNVTEYSKLLDKISSQIENEIVLEIGCGTGVLTNLIAKTNPLSLIGFEIDDSYHAQLYKMLNNLLSDNSYIIYNTFSSFIFKQMYNKKEVPNLILISNPPYDLLDDINYLIDDYQIEKIVLMIPERCLNEYLENSYKIAFSLKGEDFTPNSTGSHFIITKGFKYI